MGNPWAFGWTQLLTLIGFAYMDQTS
jgi:hypothetical protein